MDRIRFGATVFPSALITSRPPSRWARPTGKRWAPSPATCPACFSSSTLPPHLNAFTGQSIRSNRTERWRANENRILQRRTEDPLAGRDARHRNRNRGARPRVGHCSFPYSFAGVSGHGQSRSPGRAVFLHHFRFSHHEHPAARAGTKGNDLLETVLSAQNVSYFSRVLLLPWSHAGRELDRSFGRPERRLDHRGNLHHQLS